MSLRSAALVLVLWSAACGGKAAAPPAAPSEKVAAAAAPVALGGDGDGGEGYGGEGYGGLPTRPHNDSMIAAPPPVPQDPPALSAYLPESTPAMGQADPAAVYSVPVDGSPSWGKPDALVTMVVTFEFADPFSNRLRPVLVALRDKYGDDLRIVWKNFIVHRKVAQAAALAGCAAQAQGQFQPFMDALYEAAQGERGDLRYDLEAIRALAPNLGLELARFDRDLASPACRDAVVRDQQLFERLGQRAVPVAYVNGRVVQGAQPIDAFAVVIDEELAKATTAMKKKGAKRAKYYAGLVKTGRTAP